MRELGSGLFPQALELLRREARGADAFELAVEVGVRDHVEGLVGWPMTRPSMKMPVMVSAGSSSIMRSIAHSEALRSSSSAMFSSSPPSSGTV